MGREIEFRAWGPNSKYMWSWDEIKNCSLSTLTNSGEKILMQYTGLTDKNGKKIFESDFVIYRDTSGSGRKREFGPRLIKWDDFGCSFNLSKPLNPEKNDWSFEVIGDIHTTPELLEATQ